MKRAPDVRRLKGRVRFKHSSDPLGTWTVASVGVQARLIRMDADREREVASLISSYERLCAKWEQLFQKAIELLEEDFRGNPDDDAYTLRSTEG